MVCWCSCRSLISDAAALYSRHSSLVEIEPTIFNQIVVSWLYCSAVADHRPRCTHFLRQNKFTTFAWLYFIDSRMFVWITKLFKMDIGYPFILSLPTYQNSRSLSITSPHFFFLANQFQFLLWRLFRGVPTYRCFSVWTSETMLCGPNINSVHCTVPVFVQFLSINLMS